MRDEVVGWTQAAMRALGGLSVVFLVACDPPDELVCELTLAGVPVCVDTSSVETCERWGGEATNSEVEEGGPYVYCEDLYAVRCEGALVKGGAGYTALQAYYTNSADGCAATDGLPL